MNVPDTLTQGNKDALDDKGALLSVRNLRIEVGTDGESFEVVTGATLAARRGEVVGVVGESGSGKSLTLRAIAGLLPQGVTVGAGEVHVGDIDVTKADSAALRRLRGGVVGMIFQEPMTALNPTMRVGDQIAEALTSHGVGKGEARRRVVELLDAVRITDAAKRSRDYPHQLSGGMRQRVMIAIALACRPPLVIADEPTTALDVTIQAQVLEMLRELKDRFNLALLLITHDFGVIAEMADRVAVMRGGQLVEQGPVRQILRAPSHEYTQRLLRAVPGMSQR